MYGYLVAVLLTISTPSASPMRNPVTSENTPAPDVSIATSSARQTVRARQRLEYINRLKAREKIQETKRLEFQSQLGIIKDERKQQIVEQTQERLTAINTRFVSHYNEVLEKLTVFLDRLEKQVKEREIDGIGVVAQNEALAQTRKAIEDAQTSVNTQAGKVYSISITSEDTIGENVRTIIRQLRVDLKVTHGSVSAARKAVANTLELVKAIKNPEL